MGCKFQNIQDPRLQELIKKLGPDAGMTRFLREYNGEESVNTPLYSESIITGEHGPMFDDEGNYIEDDFAEIDEDELVDEADIIDEPDGSEFIDESEFEEVDVAQLLGFDESNINGRGGLNFASAGHVRIVRVARFMLGKTNEIADRIHKITARMADVRTEIKELQKAGASVQAIHDVRERLVGMMAKIDEYKEFNKKSREALVNIGKSGEVDSLNELFNEHIDFVKKINSMSYAEEDDRKLSDQILNTWDVLGQIVEDDLGDIDPDLRKFIVSVATIVNGDIRMDLNEAMKKNVIDSSSGVKISDLTYGNDVGYTTMMTRTLADTEVKILSLIDKDLKKKAFGTNAENLITQKEISKIFEDAKRDGVDVDDILEYDENNKWTGNLIGRFTGTLSDARAAIFSGFEKEINRTARMKTKGNKEETEKKLKILASAVELRNKSIQNNYHIIDISKATTTADFDAIAQKIAEDTGDYEYARKMVDEAFDKRHEFNLDKQMRIGYWNDQVANGNITKEASEKNKARFEKDNNPDIVVEYLNKDSIAYEDIRLSNYGIENYIVLVPRRKVKGTAKETGFYSEKFKTKVLNNAATNKFYTSYVNTMKRHLSFLPEYTTKNVDERFLPNIEKDFWARMSGKTTLAAFREVADNIKKAISTDANNFEYYGARDENGKLIRRVPVSFMKKIETANKSKDLENSLRTFSEMAIGYKHAVKVEDSVNLKLAVLKRMKSKVTDPSGNIVREAGMAKENIGELTRNIKMAEHFIDSNLYGSSKELEGVSKFKFFDKNKLNIKIVGSINPVGILREFNNLVDEVGVDEAAARIKKKHGDNVRIVTEKDSYKDLQERINDLDDLHDEGKISNEEYDKSVAELEEMMSKMGRNNTASKWVDNIIGYGAWKAFAYNVFPAISNMGFGWISIMNWAAGGQDFDRAEARNGIIEATNSSLRTLRGGSLEGNKAYNLAHKFQVVSDIMEGLKVKGARKLLNPFQMLSSTDYMNRVAVMIAMMHHTKLTDIAGNERTLYEAYNSDGTWNTKEFGNNTEWAGNFDVASNNESALKFTEKLRKVNRYLHGNMDTINSIMLKRNMVGRLLAQYRASWMVEGAAMRFESKRYDDVLERVVEGRYMTFGSFVKNNGILGTLGTMMKYYARMGDATFTGVRMKRTERAMIEANMRRNFQEIMVWGTMVGAWLLLKASIDDDDDDKKMKYVMLNSLNRIMGDISFYFSPMTFNQIVNNPIPASSIVTDTYRFTKALSNYVDGENPYYTEEVLFNDAARMFPIINNVSKIRSRSEKLILTTN